MNLHIYNNYHDLSSGAAERIANVIQSKPSALCCFATGDTPKGTYEHLVRRIKEKKIDISKAKFIGLDEWVGVSADNPGSCRYYLNQYLLKPLGVHDTNFHLFDGMSDDLQAECKRMDDFIKRSGGIDIIIVGIGMNGHIGFNEPGVSEELYTHVITLDPITTQVGQKYFEQQTELKQGITLGLKHISQARCVALLANGERKAPIMKVTLEGAVSNNVPASLLRKHANAHILLDSPAASLLS